MHLDNYFRNSKYFLHGSGNLKFPKKNKSICKLREYATEETNSVLKPIFNLKAYWVHKIDLLLIFYETIKKHSENLNDGGIFNFDIEKYIH